MAGFFQFEESKPKKAVAGCPSCELKDSCRNPQIQPYGENAKRVLLIAEAPGKEEDDQGKPLVGPTGRKFSRVLRDIGINMDRDCIRTNAVCCRPPGNRDPLSTEIEACRPRLEKTIKESKPKVIVLMGKAALSAYWSERANTKNNSMNTWHGISVPDHERNCWVVAVHHPSAALIYNQGNDAFFKMFQTDLKNAFALLDKPLPPNPDLESKVEVLNSKQGAQAIKSMLFSRGENDWRQIAFDYETSGLKPHGEGHYIQCVGISAGKEGAFACPVDRQTRRPLIRLLTDPRISKIAHNLQFEDAWSREILKAEVKGWSWDTMLAAHILDNRPGVSGLKFQSLVRYGVLDYSSHIERWLYSNGKSCNELNRVKEAPQKELLKYCAMDALLTMMLLQDQRKEIAKRKLGFPNELFVQGAQALARASATGIRVDGDRLTRHKKVVKKKIARNRKKIQELPEGQLWRDAFQRKTNFESPSQLKAVLKKTGHDIDSTDKSALSDIDSPLVDLCLSLRTLRKMGSTYLGGIERETVNGICHPFFNLHLVRTFRSSSDSPNLQNQPARTPEDKKLIRRLFQARPGHQLCEIDYSQLEVRIAACYHKDPTMIKYINDPNTDMHRDTAMRIYKITEDQITKPIRHAGKNKYVFPSFYGSNAHNTAPALFMAAKGFTLADGTPMLKHLKKFGLDNPDRFQAHIEKVDDWFWKKQFLVYTAWKEEWYQRYEKRGWFRTKTNFVCSGYMARTEAINYPVQGSAFHVLLWSLTQLDRWLHDNNMDSRIIGQIHDSILLDLEPSESKEVLAKAKQIMTEDVREHWPWIIVPLDIEAELAPVDGTWYDKQEVEI